MVEESRVGLFEAGVEPLLVIGQGVPRLDAGVARRAGSRRHNAALDLALQPRLADGVPAGIEPALVLVEKRLRRLVRRVHGAEREIHEEGFRRRERYVVGQELHRVIDEVFVERIALLRRLRRRDMLVVAGQARPELVGQRLEEAVVFLEAASQRPVVEWTDGRKLVGRGEVPLADRVGGIALLPEHIGNRCGVVADQAALRRKAAVGIGDGRHADSVVVAPGKQGCSRWRAERGRMEIVVDQPARCERVDVRRLDLAAVAAEAAEAHVVEEHHEDIGAAVLRPELLRPPGLGVLPGATDMAFEILSHSMLRGAHRHVAPARALYLLSRSFLAACRISTAMGCISEKSGTSS